MEGFDAAAFFSLYVAAYVVFRTCQGSNNGGNKLKKVFVRLSLVTCAAGIMASAALATLIGTQIKGIAGMNQDAEAKREHWDAATMWSLPKLETLRVIIPGLFGYRMDTPNGGNYWGAVGQAPGWEETHRGQPRHSGSGEYAGVPVVLIALWAFFRSLRQKYSPFSILQQKAIWFWAAAALVSLLFAFGRHAPFYQIIYHLPYLSTIRNPIKFMHPFQMCILILFVVRVKRHLADGYVEKSASNTTSAGARNRRLWNSADPFERRWSIGSVAAIAASVLGFLIYLSSKNELIRHLINSGFSSEFAQSIFNFSVAEIGLFIFFLTLSAAFVIAVMSGLSPVSRGEALLLLGSVIFIDLGRANLPWIVYYNYKEKYASNPVIDQLRDKPYENRVTAHFLPTASGTYFGSDQNFPKIYNEWLQHLFQYYQVQSLDIVQMPRMPELDTNFIGIFYPKDQTNPPPFARLWELSNTRYLLGMKGFIDSLNRGIDPVQKRFRIRTAFDIVPRDSQKSQISEVEDLTTVIRPEGQFAVFEFMGALPRAKLFSHWQNSGDEQATLQKLVAPSFNPAETVLVDVALPAPKGTNNGTVAITHYEPTEVNLKTHSESNSVLLLNDRYHPDWQVTVNGTRQPLLRCNFAMRGVFLPAGDHEVQFRFKPDPRPTYISFTAVLAGFVLLLWLALTKQFVRS